MHNTSLRLSTITCVCCLLSAVCFGRSPVDSSWTAQIRWMQSPWNLPTPLQHQTTDHLKHWLQSRGIRVEDKSEWIIWCDAYSFEGADSDKIVLSVGVGHTLPDRVIELGKKAEILYEGMPAEKRAALPAEGKWVRESLSEDFLYEFMMPVDHEVVIVSKTLVLKKLDAIADKLLQRHFKQ